MADTLTPERVQQLLTHDDDPATDRCGANLTYGELRALLLAYQRQQETCEWTLNAHETCKTGVSYWRTQCGMSRVWNPDGRPCWCGRKVRVVR